MEKQEEFGRFYFDGKIDAGSRNYFRKKLAVKKYRMEYEKGDILIKPGDVVDTCYYIESGYVLTYELVRGKRRIFDAFDGDNLILCNHAIAERPCPLYYQVKMPSVLYSISLLKVKTLLKNDAAFARALLAQTTRDMLVTQDLLRKSSSQNVSWLVSDFLIVMADRNAKQRPIPLRERFTQAQIADMLFINRITCFKELHRLEEKGLISLKSSNIGVLDMDGLILYRDEMEKER